MSEIVISEFMDQAAVDNLSSGFQVFYSPQLVDQPEVLLGSLSDARALIVRNRTRVDSALLHAAPHLKAVGRLGVGLDNIDLSACAQRGIEVCPARGANDAAVAEYVLATAMLLLRQAYQVSAQVIAGNWPRQSSIGREIGAKTLGLVGFGGIARQTAQRARALGMTVIAYDPHVPPDAAAWKDVACQERLSDLLQLADVVSLHVPLVESTRNLIDDKAIAQMKDGAILINTARGGIVDETALVAGLRAGKPAAAAMDVFAAEPLDEASGAAFVDAPNLLLTPHIAGVTEESNVRVSAMVADAVRKVLETRA